MSMHRILIIEDDSLARERMVTALSQHSDCEVLEAGSIKAAQQHLEASSVDLILSDLQLPDGLAIDFLVEARKQLPALEILVISVLGDQSTILSAIAAGASGYLLKDAAPLDIYATAMEVLAGGSPLSPSIARYVLIQARDAEAANSTKSGEHSILTPRETEVLREIAKGFKYHEIAQILAISPHTIPSYIKSIYKKLDAYNRSSAVYKAVKSGLLVLD